MNLDGVDRSVVWHSQFIGFVVAEYVGSAVPETTAHRVALLARYVLLARIEYKGVIEKMAESEGWTRRGASYDEDAPSGFVGFFALDLYVMVFKLFQYIVQFHQ